ncbi:hypothetical protein C8R43DRAFT_1132746 [Mycena crocata]|nr:hypothetical protein C8R43DRAFT_1132746 [Mycena crocata]
MFYAALAANILLSFHLTRGMASPLLTRIRNVVYFEGADAIHNRGIITDIITPLLPDGGSGRHARVGQKTGERWACTSEVLWPRKLDPRPVPVTTKKETFAEEGNAAGKYIGGAIFHALLGDTGTKVGEMVGGTVGTALGAVAGTKTDGSGGLI